jgi:hypothetical protein
MVKDMKIFLKSVGYTKLIDAVQKRLLIYQSHIIGREIFDSFD